MGVFEKLEARKAAGETLSLDELTSENLKAMFIDEVIQTKEEWYYD